MLLNKQLMLVLDQHPGSEKAIQRAALIAGRLHSSVSILWLGQGDEQVEAVVAGLREKGINAEWRGCTEDKLIPQLLSLWNAQHFGLLVKSCDQNQRGLMASRDGQLLRELPCPVLLVHSESSWQDGVVMAAVNPDEKRDHGYLLNNEVLLVADKIAGITDSALKVAVATPSAMLAGDPELQTPAAIAQRYHEAATTLLQKAGVSEAGLVIGEGPAEHWIPLAASEQNVNVVVIGTRARGGIKGVLIGNTAERILDRLEADVLVLRAGVARDVVPLLS